MTNRHLVPGRASSLAALLILSALAVPVSAQSAAGPPAPHAAAAQPPAGAPPTYLNPAAPLDQRVSDLVSRMTMEEKAGQLVDRAAAIPRLQVPAYTWWNEALHGVRASGVTVFPQAIGLGATFNAPLINQMANAISIEARAKFHQGQREAAGGVSSGRGRGFGLDFWAPNINIFRDPRWGRGQETYGEDPFLTARMGVAYVTGMQGDDPKYFRTIATPKHYAVHSGPETTRHSVDVKVSLHDMEDTYLPAFRAAVVEGKAGSVMCAYNRINGEPACVNTFLLQDTLRGAWKFNGYVVSDCGAITDIYQGHKFLKTLPEAAALALKKGTDSDCAMTPDAPSYLEAMQKNLIGQDEVDVNLRRLFKARFQLGLFDSPEAVKYAAIPAAEAENAAHRQLSLEVARQSMVLLKNDGVLPLAPAVARIAIVGPLADSIPALEGNYNGTSTRYTTVLDGIRKQFAPARVTFNAGTKFLRRAVVVPESAFRLADGKPGLSAEYFKNTGLTGTPVVSRTEPQLGSQGLGFVFGAAPAAAVRRLPEEVTGADFSARWTSSVTVPESREYEITVSETDAVRVWIDGKAVIDDWVPRARGRFGAPADADVIAKRTAAVTLEAGRPHELKVEFFHVEPPASPTPAPFPGMRVASGPTLSWNPRNWDRSDAVAAAKDADVVVAVVGITAQLEGEEGSSRFPLPEGFKGGDRTAIDLPADEQALLEAVKSTGKPLVVVLMNGSALAVNWASQNANAILEAWYPGEEGGAAVAETLAGANNPAGRLPVTFYKGTADLPPFEDYSMKGRTYRYFEGAPLYPFGHGLSYSTFAYGNLKLSSPSVKAGGSLDVEVDVKNTGRVRGDEVAQVYLVFPQIPGAPVRALRAFQRVPLEPGQSKRVRFTLGPRELSSVSEAGDHVVAPGPYRVFVGGGQPGTGAPGVEAAVSIQGQVKLSR
jgi:beta-glucosidase